MKDSWKETLEWEFEGKVDSIWGFDSTKVKFLGIK